jgi:hypothetical protein
MRHRGNLGDVIARSIEKRATGRTVKEPEYDSRYEPEISVLFTEGHNGSGVHPDAAQMVPKALVLGINQAEP